jgi:hypothetical protein
MVNKGFFRRQNRKAFRLLSCQENASRNEKSPGSDSIRTEALKSNNQAVTPTPIGHDTPVPPSPQ